ncbi:MAG: teicoplanin resistance protein VanZ [Oleiphilus sp.]|nr:MAG: teicoplanin resistance protein VanZ [Oleiphilus sp.]
MRLSRAELVSRIVFYSALICGCVLAFSPGGNALHQHMNDKLLHGAGFVVMAFLAHAAHPHARILYPFIGLIFFGLLIELVQAFLPYRSFSVGDLLADIAGLAVYHVLFRSTVTAAFASYRYGPG